jgi:hypothetical protein
VKEANPNDTKAGAGFFGTRQQDTAITPDIEIYRYSRFILSCNCLRHTVYGIKVFGALNGGPWWEKKMRKNFKGLVEMTFAWGRYYLHCTCGRVL